jgi:hypothetical protein
MKPHFEIRCFSEFVLRTPLFPLSNYLELLENYSLEKAFSLYNTPIIKEAINLASPELVSGLDKWVSGTSTLSNDKKKAFELTFLKYMARISSRCTPFGLFAGCSVGNLDTETNIILDAENNHSRFTQFDMHYWVSLLQDIAKRKEIAVYLKFFPNSSVYEVGEFYRFVEYKYAETKREHVISAIRKSDLLKEILSKAKSGITIDEMIAFLVTDESEKEEAFEFISQLIVFQFLVSELDAVITGDDEWKRTFSILDKIPHLNNEIGFFKDLQENLSHLDKCLVPSQEIYDEIRKTINKIGTPYEEKYLFQTDLNVSALKNKLNADVSQKVLKAIRFLNGIQASKELVNLENFKKSFIERYESAEKPLSFVLDTEIGIGYHENHEMNDIHEILESYSFKAKNTSEKNEVWTNTDFILQKKLQNSILNNDGIIVLSENDFPDFDADFKNTPVTFSVIVELFDENNIALTSTGNTSASKLLSRFCNGNKQIHKFTKEIIQKENEYHSDKILAEIVHIPESRIGNIIRRPILRKHEISYLCAPGVSRENNLDLNDLWISIKSRRVVLYSKKQNREILPCLSNAHNFLNNSLPIYHFLCDLERQNIKPISTFNWGILASQYDFFPRVIYNEVILSKAKWIIKKDEIIDFCKIDKENLMLLFSEWRRKRNIPRYVTLSNSNNTLLYDFESKISIELFLKSGKNQEKSILEEFLFTEKSAVQNIEGAVFCNQIILSYYKERS